MTAATLSGTGVWSAGLLTGDPAEVVEAAVELEELGYTSIWIPGFGSGTFEAVERLLSATRTITVATGIVNIWVVSAEETAAACARLRVTHGDRFLLGLGVSHAPLVEALVPNARYERPLRAMKAFLDDLDAATTPVQSGRRVLAALGAKMLEIAGRRGAGAHPYNVTPEHTATARATLGASKLLVPEQAVALTTSAYDARRYGRAFLEHYLQLPNYTGNLRRLGFDDDDLAGGGSDRLVDALIAWGDDDSIKSRVKAHREAGADSVCLQVVSDGDLGGMIELHREVWRFLAPAVVAA